MLSCEGYKMFRGTGEIHNAKTGALVDKQDGDWLYKPEYDCWYVNGSSYPAECVKVVDDETKVVRTRHGRWEKSYADHVAFGVRPFFRYCSECHEATVHQYNYCPNCGARCDL